MPATNDPRAQLIVEQLLQLSQEAAADVLFPALLPEASELISEDDYAFAIAATLDRGIKAEVAWTIPYYLKSRLGHLEPAKIHAMTTGEISGHLDALPRKLRYRRDAPRTVKELTALIMNECEGDASGLWRSGRAGPIKRTFMSVHGVGEGIASMILLLLERRLGVEFSDLDHATMDVKPDVHVVRVLYRLGMSKALTEAAALSATRLANPAYPGALDAALWTLGRGTCSASAPACECCRMNELCPRVGLTGSD